MLIYLKNFNLLKSAYFFLILFLIFSGISISVSQISLGIAILCFIIAVYKKKIILSYTGLEKYIIPFISISIILSFLSPKILKNLDYIRDFWLLSAFVLVYFIYNSKENVVKTFNLIVFITLLHSIIALIQIYFNMSFINDAHEIGIFRHSWEHMKIRGGLLGMHLVFSCYMMLISMPVIYVSIGAIKKIKSNINCIIIFTAILSIVVLLITRTRSIIIALPFAVVPLLFVNKKFRVIAISFLIILSILAILLLIYRGQDQLSAQNKGSIIDSFSTEQRQKIWKTAFYVWLKHPIIGAGGGNYLDEFRVVVKEHPEWDTGMVTHAHNDYLNQLARKGIIGFAAFLYMLFGIFKYMAINFKFIQDKLLKGIYLGLFGAYCVFLVASLFQCFYTDDENLVMFWFNIGLLAAIVKIEKSNMENNILNKESAAN